MSEHSIDPRHSILGQTTDDFFHYVNSRWIKENTIPPEEARWGSFNVLRAEADKKIYEILKELEKAGDGALDPTSKKVRDFYLTAMDVEKLNTLKAAPLQKY